MAYTVESLRAAVRALIHNITPKIYPDDQLDAVLRLGKARLDIDRPNSISATIIGTDHSYFKLTNTVAGWEPNFSTIQHVIYPVPDQSLNESPIAIDYKGFMLTTIGDEDYIYAASKFMVGKNANIQFTAPWTVAGLSEATTTTVFGKYQTALELISSAFACVSMMAKAAGSLDDQVPADQINYRSMEQEWGRTKQEFLDLYADTLGLNSSGAPKAILVRRDFDDLNPNRFLTHRTWINSR